MTALHPSERPMFKLPKTKRFISVVIYGNVLRHRLESWERAFVFVDAYVPRDHEDHVHVRVVRTGRGAKRVCLSIEKRKPNAPRPEAVMREIDGVRIVRV